MSPQQNVTLYDWVENYENKKVDKSSDIERINTRIGEFVYDFVYERVSRYLDFPDIGNDPDYKNFHDNTITDLKKEFIEVAIEDIYTGRFPMRFDVKMLDDYEKNLLKNLSANSDK